MIIIQDFAHNTNPERLTKIKERGNDNLITEFPSGINARYFENGQSAALSSIDIYNGVAERLADYIDGDLDEIERIADKLNCGTELTPEEFECLVNRGFCAFFAMRYPELLDNKTFQFIAKGVLAIELLEEQCIGKSYSEFIDYVDKTSSNKDASNKELYQAIKESYRESDREKYLRCHLLNKSEHSNHKPAVDIDSEF